MTALVEYEGGQIALMVDVVERNGQQAFPEVARPAIPAPVEPTGLFGAQEELERREELAWRDGPKGRRTLSNAEKRSRGANLRTYRCADCGRKLTAERWVYSRHTGARYCTPGEGCNTPTAYAMKDRQRAKTRKEA